MMVIKFCSYYIITSFLLWVQQVSSLAFSSVLFSSHPLSHLLPLSHFLFSHIPNWKFPHSIFSFFTPFHSLSSHLPFHLISTHSNTSSLYPLPLISPTLILFTLTCPHSSSPHSILFSHLHIFWGHTNHQGRVRPLRLTLWKWHS